MNSSNSSNLDSIDLIKNSIKKKQQKEDAFETPGLMPLKSKVNDHKIKSIRAKEESLIDEIHLDEIEYDDDSIKLNEKSNANKLGYLNELNLSEPNGIDKQPIELDTIPEPNERTKSSNDEFDKDRESEQEIVKQIDTDQMSTNSTFYKAIHKIIEKGINLDKLQKKDEYVNYLKAIKSTNQFSESKSDDIQRKKKANFKLNSSKFLSPTDDEKSSSSNEPSLKSSTVSFASKKSVKEPLNDLADKTESKKTKAGENLEEESNVVPSIANVAIYGTATTLLSAGLYYLINYR